jgi:hypothetical protein
VLGFLLVVAQAFFHNAIFFTYGLALIGFYGVTAGSLRAVVVNVPGPILIGGGVFAPVGFR